MRSTGRFVWAHLPAVVAVSVAWTVASLPIVTVGPATVGAYRAVLSLRAGDGVDFAAVREAVRSQFVHATLLGLTPLVLLAMTGAYAVDYLRTGAALSGVLALGGFYVTTYVGLVLVPTLIGLAAGEPVSSAFRSGYLWTARHAVEAVVLGVVTAGLFVLTSVLTVAAVLLFAGVAFAFHVEFVTAVSATPTDGTDGVVPR
jgi:hypothetical protein